MHAVRLDSVGLDKSVCGLCETSMSLISLMKAGVFFQNGPAGGSVGRLVGNWALYYVGGAFLPAACSMTGTQPTLPQGESVMWFVDFPRTLNVLSGD